MFKDQGFFVFYKGLLCTYAKVMPATAIAFAINEKLKRFRNLSWCNKWMINFITKSIYYIIILYIIIIYEVITLDNSVIWICSICLIT